jgi:hypothetical protein
VAEARWLNKRGQACESDKSSTTGQERARERRDGAPAPRANGNLQIGLVGSPRAAPGHQKVFEDVFAFAALQRSAATAARDLPVEIDVVARHTHELITRLAIWAVE